MADVISNIIDDKQDIKNQLGSLPNTLKVPFRFTEDVEPAVLVSKYEHVDTTNVMIWGRDNWGTNWGGTTTSSTYAVIPQNNTFVEYFDQNMFISSSSTGTLNSETYTLADTQILESNVIAKLRTPINSVTPNVEWESTGDLTNLAGWWKLDGNALDSAGSNNGTWSGTEAYDIGKQFINSANFDNLSSDNISVSGLSSIFTQTGTFSVSCWVYQNATGTNMFVWSYAGGTSNRMGLNINGTNLAFQRYNGTTYLGKNFATGSKLNQWTHIVCINNAGTMELYQDGVLATTTITNYNTGVSGNTFILGYPNNGSNGSQSINGKVGDVRIYNKVLSADEIALIYNGGNGYTTNESTAKLEVTNNGTNWYTATNGNKYTFSASADTNELAYRVTGIGPVLVNKVTMGVNQ